MPRLYHALVEEDHTLSGGVQGRRLLLLLRTLIRNPGRGALIKNVTASTWLSLDTDCLTEDDMKAVFEQTERITASYPWQVDVPFDPSDPKPICLWQENPGDLPCNVQCLSAELLQSHVNTEHIATYPLSNNICRWSGCGRPGEKGRLFWKSHLKAHLCSHIGLTVASCPLCRQDFTSLQAVDVHLKDHHMPHEFVREEGEVEEDVRLLKMSDQIGEELPSSGPPESAGLLQDWVTHDSSHPLSDFPFCSALAWSHEIRRGEWDPIFSFFLSYLPNLESLTVQDPDAGARCPFSQCYYLTTFMKRAAISQLRRSHSTSIRGLSSHLRNNPSKHQLTRGSSRLQPVVSKKRKWSFPDELQLSNNKRYRADKCTSEAMPCAVPEPQKSTVKTSAANAGASVSADNTQDKDVMERAQESPPAHALLPHLRSVTLDCMYRSGDVHFADVLPFVAPPSVETLSCSYLVDDHGTALKAARLDLKTIAIKNGQLTAVSVADLIKACPLLKSFSFEVGGACEIAYQTLASVDVKNALDRVAGTLEHLDLMKADMNYWRPDYDVSRLEGHCGFTFDSFRNFKRLKRLYLKAETMVRHSKDDPEADTGPLWAKLPASLKELHLAGNEKYFANILREIQELLLHRIEALPRLQRIVMSWREDGDESESPQSWAETLVVSFGKETSICENQRIVVRFLARILKNMEPSSGGEHDDGSPPHNLPA